MKEFSFSSDIAGPLVVDTSVKHFVISTNVFEKVLLSNKVNYASYDVVFRGYMFELLLENSFRIFIVYVNTKL